MRRKQFQSTYQYKRIIENIKLLINSKKLNPGDRVPSVDEIKNDFKVSHITAMRAFKELTKENLIYLVRGKGYFVTDRTAGNFQEYKCIASFVRPYRTSTYFDNLYNEINMGIQRECLSYGYDLLSSRISLFLTGSDSGTALRKSMYDEIIGAAKELNEKVDGFIFDECLQDDILEEILRNISKPGLLINRRSKLPLDCVCADNIKGGKYAAELAVRSGYKNFVIMKSETRNTNREDRISSFIDTLKTKKIPKKHINIIKYSTTEKCNTLFDELMDICNNLDNKSQTLIFAASDSMGRYIIDRMPRQKRKTGLIGYDGMGYASYKKPELTTIKIDTEKMGRMAVNVLIDKINNRNVNSHEVHTVDVTLQMGETI